MILHWISLDPTIALALAVAPIYLGIGWYRKRVSQIENKSR